MTHYNLPSIQGREKEVRRLSLVQQLKGIFSEAILQCDLLVKLDLRRNQLPGLPAAFGALSQLEELDLGENKLETGSLSFPAGLKKLSLRANGLTAWPAAVFELGQLEELDLSDNQIGAVPASIERLKNLKKLILRGNSIAKLPPQLGKLSAILELDVSKNRIGHLPKWVGNWEKMRVLDLSHNRLRQLPDEIGRCQALETLKLGGNRLKVLPTSLRQVQLLRRLDASRNQLEAFPDFTQDLPWLAYLNLSHNRLQRLPEQVSGWQRLQELQLRDNHLLVLPETLAALPQLQHLDVGKNQLTSPIDLPERLVRLEIDGNRLTTLPQHFPPLQEFDFSGNQIRELPAAFFQLTGLRKLSAGGNPLTCRPEALAAFYRLRSLNGLLPAAQKKQLLDFLKTEQRPALPARLYAPFFRILRGDQSVFQTLTGNDLLAGLAMRESRIRLAVRRHLYREWGISSAKQALKKGASLFILGKTYFDEAQLQLLSSLGVQIVPQFSAAVTHMLVGHPPYTVRPDLPRAVAYLSEQQLSRWVDRRRKAHLIYQADEAQLDNLRRMLLHQDKANVEMALQLLRGGGVPPTVLPDLQAAWKKCREEGLKNRLHALLMVNTADGRRPTADG